jgi:hypothetical protein
VQPFVTGSAHSYQIGLRIAALPTARLFVVDLQVLPGTTNLTSPAIAQQNLFSELVVSLGIKLQAR